ncbi:hypothetical protein ACLIX2_09035 [Proteus cibi]
MKIKKVSFVWKNIDKSEQFLIDMVTCRIETDDGEVYEGSATQPIPRQVVITPPNSQRMVTAHEVGEVAAYRHTIDLMRQVTNTQV